MSSITPTSGGYAVQPPQHPPQNQNQTTHNGQTQQNGQTHSTQTHVSAPPQNSHLGKSVNKTA
jgi:hypothetical protein